MFCAIGGEKGDKAVHVRGKTDLGGKVLCLAVARRRRGHGEEQGRALARRRRVAEVMVEGWP